MPEIERSQHAGRRVCVCQSRPLTVELGGLLRAFDCFFFLYRLCWYGYYDFWRPTVGSTCCSLKLRSYSVALSIYLWFFFLFCCGRGIHSETFDFLDCANYSVFLVKVFLRYKLPPLKGASYLVSIVWGCFSRNFALKCTIFSFSLCLDQMPSSCFLLVLFLFVDKITTSTKNTHFRKFLSSAFVSNQQKCEGNKS